MMSIRLTPIAVLALSCHRLLALDLSDPAEPWRTSRTGISTQVPAPFEKLAVAGQKVSCWGREYTLGTPLPRQISSQDEPLLAGPMRVVIQQGGQTAVLADQDMRVTATADDRVEFVGEGRAGNMPVRVAGWLEYDGAMQVRLTANPAGPATVERLAVEIPLRPEIARFFHVSSAWGKYIYDRIGERPGWKWSLDWQALTWVGDHNRGLTFVTQTSANWTGAKDRALELERTAEAVVFRANLIGEPTELKASRTWTLGLQATPGKALPPTWHGRYVGTGGIAASARAAETAATGQTVALIWYTDTQAFSYPEARDAAAMKAAVKAYHDAGMGVVVYITLSGTGTDTEVMKRHRDEWLMGEDFKALFEQNAGEKTDDMTSTCPASSYADWLVWAVDRAMAEYDLDGVYLDNAGPYYCSNERHGCGGAEVRTHPYFANRELHQRLWNVIHGRKPETGMIWEHNSRTSNSFNLTFVDVYSDGEQFRILDKSRPEEITPTLLDITASGRQWGAQPSFLVAALNLREQYTDWLLARTLPYGNVVMCEPPYMDFSRLIPVLQARRAFGLGEKTVEWYTPEAVPEWLPVQPAGLLVGAYYRSDRKLLLTIGNPTEAPLAARLDLAKLQPKLGEPVTVTDATTGIVCPPLGRSMVLAIPANSFRVVLLEPEH